MVYKVKKVQRLIAQWPQMTDAERKSAMDDCTYPELTAIEAAVKSKAKKPIPPTKEA